MAVWSTVNFSTLIGDRRMDAEFYRPEYLALDRLLSPERATPWGELAGRFIVGPFGSNFLVENYLAESPYRYIRGRDVKSFFLLEDQNCYIPQGDFARLNKYHVKPGDLLVSVVGTIGAVAVVTDDIQQAVFSCKSTAYRSESIDAYYLCAYLNSPTGQAYLARMIRGHVQTGLNLPDLKRVPILRVDPAIEEEISSLVKKAYSAQQQAKALLKQAESDLNAALGLDRVDLAPRLFYEDRFSKVAAAGRFDAEYYQPGKWDVLRSLAAMKGSPISEHFRSVRKLWQPDRQAPTCEVRNYDLTDALSPFLDDAKPITTAPEIGSTKKVLKQGDLVISRLRSYLKEIAVVLTSGETPLVGSTEFIVLRQCKTTISPEALLVFLRSPYVQTILKWSQDGSNHPRFDEKVLLAIQVPQIIQDIRDELEQKIKRAFTARQESRRLLETAKRAVEIAIEEGEAAAREFLNRN